MLKNKNNQEFLKTYSELQHSNEKKAYLHNECVVINSCKDQQPKGYERVKQLVLSAALQKKKITLFLIDSRLFIEEIILYGQCEESTLKYTSDFITFQNAPYSEMCRFQYLYETTFCQKYLKVSNVPLSSLESSSGLSKS